MVHHKNKPKVLDNKKMKNTHNTLSEIVIHIQQEWEVQRGGEGVRRIFYATIFTPKPQIAVAP